MAASVFAQGPGGPGGAPQKTGLAAGLQRAYAGIKGNVTQSAEKMNEADYGSRPHADSRTFGQLFGHIANAQFGQCSGIKGEANPSQAVDFETKTTKAEFLKALADSFAYCDPIIAGLTDESLLQYVPQGRNEVVRAISVTGLIAHSNEMYGTAAAYLRAKGIVPPSTERAQQRR
jgi:hypothetical protein